MSGQATLHNDHPRIHVIDQRGFRRALGYFPTGVAIVTTRTPEGRPVGLTINSFSSLSLEPPLVMWSLANRSVNLSVFQNCAYFAINILRQEQVEAAMGFADPNIKDKFALVSHADGQEGVPLIDNCVATFVCENYQQYPGGDHTIFIGQVVRHSTIAKHEPAVFHRGQFTSISHQPNDDSAGEQRS